MDVADAEKKVKNLRKKITQIEALRSKGTDGLDADQQKKLDSEPELRKELAEAEAVASGAAPAVKKAAPASPKNEAASAPPSKEKKEKKTKKEDPEPAPAQDFTPTGPSLDQEKRIKTLKKKLGQIEKLREKGEALDADAQEKLASEPEILKEIAALERGEEFVPEVKAPSAKKEKKDKKEVAVEEDEPLRPDKFAEERAAALEPPSADIGLLLDDEHEKRFKKLQKDLREIGKLLVKDNLDKLQTEKLTKEAGAIDEVNAIRSKMEDAVEARRAKYAPPPREMQPEKEKKAALNHHGESNYGSHLAKAPAEKKAGAKVEVEEEEEAKEVKVKERTYMSKDLMSNRQKAQPAAATDKFAEHIDSSKAHWPEVKDVLDSGGGGTDKSRVKKAILVEKPKSETMYNTFDTTLLRCNFLTRIELRLPPGVLMQEAFQLYFPGSLSDNLLELILKGNDMKCIPQGLSELKRIRSIDLSHNAIEELPESGTWDAIGSSLELLDLSFNKLASITDLAPLTKLSSLKVDGNQLESLEGISWSKLKQLSSLTGVGNKIKEFSEEVGERGDSLENIDLSNNEITVCPTSVVDLKKLKWLKLEGCPLKDQKVVKYLADAKLKDLKAYLSKNANSSKGKKK